jgi:hypothetical protein
MAHVAIISHDAGGAEILSSWLNRGNFEARIAVEGPAKEIFTRKCPSVNFVSAETAINESDWMLSGTGWQSNFEIDAIAFAKSKHKKSVAFLDHWVNYRERFCRNGKIILPDEIWVGDSEAEKIALELFSVPVVLNENPYVLDLLEELSSIRSHQNRVPGTRILYVCEPIADHAFTQFGNPRHWGYTEIDALKFFLLNLRALQMPTHSITVRPHPSEGSSKYEWVCSQTSVPVNFGGKKSLIEEIIDADIVVGCESMALVIALHASKRVISSIPFGGRKCQLPHPGIERLSDLCSVGERHS